MNLSSKMRTLVTHYENNYQQLLNDEEVYHRNQLNNPNFCHKVAYFIAANDKTHPHQRNIAKDTKEDLEQYLQKSLTRLLAKKDFHELKEEFVRTKGIGDMSAYDTARFIGDAIGIEPNVVYIHRGAKDGFFALFGPTKAKALLKGRNFIEKSVFPKELQRLSPKHIENFLCIYKDVLSSSIVFPTKSCYGIVVIPETKSC